MKETPLIMSSPMVKATFSGTKHMTRRTWGLEKVNKSPDEWELMLPRKSGWDLMELGQRFKSLVVFRNKLDGRYQACNSPYGGVGDKLYIRETWALGAYTHKKQAEIIYKAGGSLTVPWNDWLEKHTEYGASSLGEERWRPSIFLPRWASRITLEITGRRCERLQDITVTDCLAEGITTSILKPAVVRGAFMDLWDSVYDKGWSLKEHPYRWGLNPWVGVISYKRIDNAHP